MSADGESGSRRKVAATTALGQVLVRMWHPAQNPRSAPTDGTDER